VDPEWDAFFRVVMVRFESRMFFYPGGGGGALVVFSFGGGGQLDVLVLDTEQPAHGEHPVLEILKVVLGLQRDTRAVVVLGRGEVPHEGGVGHGQRRGPFFTTAYAAVIAEDFSPLVGDRVSSYAPFNGVSTHDVLLNYAGA
jgi:hypothetical protein